jgi:hypothetical protein
MLPESLAKAVRPPATQPSILQTLAASDEPSIRYRVLTELLEAPADSAEVRHARQEVKRSRRVAALLAERGADGRLPYHPYAKWHGAHWILVSLAELGYPPGDRALIPLREQVFEWLLGEDHRASQREIQGRVRIHASQEGNALYSQLALGIADRRTEQLVDRLKECQWPDGGWNCDRNPRASQSSFMETLTPLRGLALHAKLTGDASSQRAVDRASEVFLVRHLFKRQRDGATIHPDFLRLHFPCYWHYDILFGLKVMAQVGKIRDPRCREALAALESKRLSDGGFPAEAGYYRTGVKVKTGRSLANWGGVGVRRSNEFVTVDALGVLKAAGRLRLGKRALSS